jgi:hypothetical protein
MGEKCEKNIKFMTLGRKYERDGNRIQEKGRKEMQLYRLR